MDTHDETLVKVNILPLYGGVTTPVRWRRPLLTQACALADLFDDQPDDRVRMSMAVQLEQVSSPAFYQALGSALSTSRVDPQRLELSLSEPKLDETLYTASDFSELRAMGVPPGAARVRRGASTP